MRYVTTCRWNGLDTGREVEIAEEHVSAFAGEIAIGILRRVTAPPGPNAMTAADYLASQALPSVGVDRGGFDGPSWQPPAIGDGIATMDSGPVEVGEVGEVEAAAVDPA